MNDRKRLTADFFLVLQLCLAAISGGSQFVRLLTTSQGLNISWLASWLAFLLINLALTPGKEGINDSIFPTEYRIDYVRIYRIKKK
jgi:hypothetical protein